MLTFLAGQDTIATLSLEDTGLELTALSYKVVDQDDIEIVPLTILTGWAVDDAEVAITVPAVSNALTAGKTISARSVILYLVGTGAAAGRMSKRVTYALVAEDRLPTPTASFQSLLSADMVASDMVNVDAWDTATDTQKVVVLMEARNRLVQLRYRWCPDDFQRRMNPTIELDEYEFNQMSESSWAAMDPQFKQAMKRAQVMEAVGLLGSDQDATFRAAGVTSITIGESSRTYLRTRDAASKMPLSLRAMQILEQFLAPHRLVRT